MKHQLPDLPYEKTALEPHMSAETLEYHHGKHHATYVEKLNGLIEGTEYEDMRLEEIVVKASGGVFNNAAQSWNHAFFWNCLTPDTVGTPEGKLAEAIERDFGGIEQLREQFSDTLTGLFGSGWVWLVRDKDGKLGIEARSNADNPMTDMLTPLLTCDMWEHAYYIDYRNAKAKYYDAFWELITGISSPRTLHAKNLSACETPGMNQDGNRGSLRTGQAPRQKPSGHSGRFAARVTPWTFPGASPCPR